MPPPKDPKRPARPEPAPVDFSDIVRIEDAALAVIPIEDIGAVFEMAPLPSGRHISPGDVGLGLEQAHTRKMFKLETAQWLAYGVLALFSTTVVFLLVWGLWAGSQDQTKTTASVSDVMDFGKFIRPFQVTALGVALGFYFAGRSE